MEFPNGKGLPCLSFADQPSLDQCQPLLHLVHNPEGRGILFGLFPKEALFALSAISSQMSYSTIIKTFDIFMSPHTFGNRFSYSSLLVIIKRLNIG